ncbi:Pyridoxal biosynthesis protein PDX2 [Ceratocystis lukuohia]|uniref:glutaminase n=1 Tax=Ceratocystis lukuohia TaxID=2019550 RepID=A0ABR4MFF4_9PEZI
MVSSSSVTVGVLALQGGFHEHLNLLRQASKAISSQAVALDFIEVRTPAALDQCDALIIPGGESTTIANIAEQSGLMQPLRDFVNHHRKPVWGTCAGLILLSDEASATKQGGQALIGGLNVRVQRNHFGRQIESFFTPLDLPFLSSSTEGVANEPFQAVFIRAPIVEEILPPKAPQNAPAQVLASLPVREDSKGRDSKTAASHGDIVAIQQGNILGTSFHPELTNDSRIHEWWLRQVLDAAAQTTVGQQDIQG